MDPNFFLQNALANQQAGAQVKRQHMQNPRMMMQYGQQQNSSPAMPNAAAQYGSPYVSAASPINNYAAAASQVNNPAFSAAAFGSVDPQLMAGMNPVFNQNMQTMMGADGGMVGNPAYNQVSQQQSQSPFNQPAYLGANGNGMTQQGMAPNVMAARYQQYSNTPAQIQAQMQQLQQGAGVFKAGQQMGMSPTVSSPFMMQQQPVNVMNAQRQAKQSPSQSPSLNNASYANTATGSPIASNSSPMIGAQNYGNVMSGHGPSSAHSSPAQTFAMPNQSNSATVSPQMHRNSIQGAQQRYSPYNKPSFAGGAAQGGGGLTPQQIQALQQQHFQRQQQQQQQQQQIPGYSGSPQQQNAAIAQAQMNQGIRTNQQQAAYQQMAQGNSKPADDNKIAEKLWSEHLQSQKPIPMALPPSVAQQQRTRTSSQSSLDNQAVTPTNVTPSLSGVEARTPKTGSATPQTNNDTLNNTPNLSNDARAASVGSPTVAVKSAEVDIATESPAGQDKCVSYIPKTRNVDTYGGVDLKYFDKFEIRPMLPTINELGIIDIHAITMSLKSEMKLEVSNALNILTVLTSTRGIALSMRHCDDLLDVLLDYLEQDLMGTNSRYGLSKEDSSPSQRAKAVDQAVTEKERTYGELFEMSLDEMKSLIPSLEKTTSDVWLSSRERCLCIINIIRNLSFMPENQEYFGKHKRLTDLLAFVLDTDVSVTDDADKTSNGEGLNNKKSWYIGIRHMDSLDYRKSALLIFSNIAVFLKLASASCALVFIKLTNDFLMNGPDTYFSQIAVETWAKVSVSYENRNVFASLCSTSASESHGAQDDDAFTYLENVWEELASIIRRDYFSHDGRVLANMKAPQLALLEMAVMGLYNIMVIAKEESLRARLLARDRAIGMDMVKLCVSLAEYGSQHFSVVCRRGLEFVRGLITGGDGLRRKTDDNAPKDNVDNQAETSTSTPQPDLATRLASKLELDSHAINHLLMFAMLNPATDPDTTRELWDIQALLEEES